MLLHTLDPRNRDHWPYLIGIAAHVYADTFSHFGFIGIAHPWNKVKSDSIEASDSHSASIIQYIKTKFEDFKTRFAGDFAEMIPVGHGPVATYPDRPYLSWRFQYEDGNHAEEVVDRDNVAYFLDGCKGLYEFFSEFSRVDPGIQDISGFRAWEAISDGVENLLKREAPRDGRIKAWKETISSGLFCHVSETDMEIHYDPDSWKLRVAQDSTGEDSGSYRFFKAAWSHRNYVLHELFPEIGLLL